MVLSELIALVRNRIDDTVYADGYLVSDAQIIQFANTAERQICERGAAIYDDTTASVCRYAFLAGVASATLSPSVLSVLSARWDGQQLAHLPTHGYEDLKDTLRTISKPRFFLQTGSLISLFPTPETDGLLTLATYRYPLQMMEMESDEPEIPEAHHIYMAHWMTYEAASLWDESGEGVYDPELAQRELTLFDRRYGPPRSAAELRSWRELPRGTQAKPRYFA
jgi:hypothetical protein